MNFSKIFNQTIINDFDLNSMLVYKFMKTHGVLGFWGQGDDMTWLFIDYAMITQWISKRWHESYEDDDD